MTKTFEMNSKTYRNYAETLQVLRSVVKAYDADGRKDASAISAMMHLGIMTCTITAAA